MKPKIAFVETSDHFDEIEKEIGPLAESIMISPERLENVVDEIKDFDIVSTFISSNVDRKVLSKFSDLKLIVTRSTGYDHIDVGYANKRGITVSNIPYYGENTVAEHTFSLILSLTRNVHRAYVRTQRKDFSLEGLVGFDLKGKTIGVVGAGHIGLYVIKMAKGFGMNVLAFDINQDDFIAEVLGFTYSELDELMKNSDIISLHAPYNQKTHHMINKENISKIKPGALLINTARGALVDTEAMIWALENGILNGVGLDVLEGETLIEEELEALSSASKDTLTTLIRDHALLNREDVVITPHIAFYSQEAVMRIWETTFGDILAFLGGDAVNTVSIKKKAA